MQEMDWRLLLIDNDEEDYLVTRALLAKSKARKIHIDWAATFEDGWTRLTESQHGRGDPYDAVLVDYDLSDRSGVEIIQQFGASYPAPLILYTGQGSHEVDLEAQRAGATMYLAKDEATPLLLERIIRYAIERKQAERALQQSQAALQQRLHEMLESIEGRLRSVWEVTQDAMVLSDAQGTVLAANPAYFQLYGFTAEEILGQNFAVIFPIAERATARQQYLEAFTNPAVPPQFETVIQRKDGQARIVEAKVSFITEKDSTDRRAMLSVIRDITERKRVEAEREQLLSEIRAQNELLAQIVREAPIGVAIVAGPDHRYQIVNDYYQQTSAGKGDLLGRTVGEVFAEVAEELVAPLDQVYRSGEIFRAVDAPLTTLRAGVPVEGFFSFTFLPLKNQAGAVERIMILVLETTEQVRVRQIIEAELVERRQMEQALRESEQKFHSAFDQAAIGFVMRLADGRLLDANPAYCQLTGYDLEELRTLTIEQLIYPEDYAENKRLTDQLLDGQIDDFLIENRYVRKDGQRVWVRKRVSLVRTPQGEAQWMISLTEDITSQKRAEQNLEVYAAELERSNQALREFASIASHDLQEPLRKVQAFGEMLDLQYSDRLGAEGKAHLDRMTSAAARMSAMLDSLLSYSRITLQGKPFVTVDLLQVAQEVLSDLEVRLAETGGRVTLGELPILQADPMQMRQLLQNLIGNALKYHRAEAAPQVQISCQKTGNNCIELTVQDNGIGFNMKDAGRIFQPFIRLHGRQAFEGTGMGLAICQKIVERHGGTISVESAPGEGSTFTVRLPIWQ